MRVLGLLFILVSAAPAVAGVFKVIKTNADVSRVIVSGDVSSLKPGDTLEYRDEFDLACHGKVQKVQDGKVILDISGCKNKNSVVMGSSLTEAQGTAALSEPHGESKPAPRSSLGLPTINEDWYLFWGLGFSRATYEDDLDDALKALDDLPGVSRTTLTGDLGFYWPTTDYKTMYGVALNFTSDRLHTNDVSLTIAQYLLGFSTQHFFGANIGNGWFVRGDVGLAWYFVSVDMPDYDLSDSSKFGLGVLGGGGYSFVIGEETRMPLGAYYALRSAEGDTMGAFNVTLSFLF